jgi:dolichol-phosphate mannosyltransferase
MIIAALPAYNEAEALPRLLQRMRECQSSFPNQCASSSSTMAARTRPRRCRAVRQRGHARRGGAHDANRGLHGALDTGFRAALERAEPGDWILTMDADDTHPPEPRRRDAGQSEVPGATVVIASRFHRARVVWLELGSLLFSKDGELDVPAGVADARRA